MTRINIFILTLFLTLSPFTVSAHGAGHGAPAITHNQAESIAITHVSGLVESQKIDKSWKLAKLVSTEQKAYNHEPEWLVTFKNSQVSNPEKSTLYIFLSSTGEYLAANFTGK